MMSSLDTESLWREFHAQIFKFIRRRVREDALAEDLTQQVFLRIHTRIETLRDETKIAAWIFQIARNVIADHYRAQSESAPLHDEIPEPETDTDDLAEQLAPSIRSFVNALPPNYRDAFLLTEVQGISQVELARQLDISVSGAKSRVQRARAQLRQMLLDCCHFEFDRLGGLVDYSPRASSCKCSDCKH